MEEVTFSCSSFECIQSFIQMTVVMGKNACPCSSSSLIQTRQLPAFVEKMLPRLSSAHNKAYHTHTRYCLSHALFSTWPIITTAVIQHHLPSKQCWRCKNACVCLCVCMLVKPSIFYVSYIGKVGSIYTSL